MTYIKSVVSMSGVEVTASKQTSDPASSEQQMLTQKDMEEVRLHVIKI